MYTDKLKKDQKLRYPTIEENLYYASTQFETDQALDSKWPPLKLCLFRFLFVFFALQIVPWHPAFYSQLFSIDWVSPHFKHLLDLVIYLPELISTARWGLHSYFNWFIFGGISIVVSIVWSIFDKSATQYNFLQYLLRAALRYKLGAGLVVCGFYLFFQQQMPYPSLSNLHTNYGDLFAWKLYFQTTAINPGYQSFLGFVEILAGVLILFPKTVTIGTGVLIGFLGNVAMVNLFYDVGHHVYVNFLLLAAVFLFSYDIPRLYGLLVKGSKAVGKKFYPDWSNSKFKTIRQVFRLSVLTFLLLTGARAYALVDQPYKIPQNAGIKGAFGYYIPTEFKINDIAIPYSLTDSLRWQDVIFEEWSTISIRINRDLKADIRDGDEVEANDIDRNYELAGSGGRHYFHYSHDEAAKTINLQNKNIHHRNEKLSLRYSFPTDSTMVLEGINERNEKIYANLLRIKKKYFMYEGRRNRIKL